MNGGWNRPELRAPHEGVAEIADQVAYEPRIIGLPAKTRGVPLDRPGDLLINALRRKIIHMAKQEPIKQEGVVTDALPNAQFRVELDNGHEVLGLLSGKMRKFFIRIIPGDRVDIEMSPYDLTKGRIVYRYKS